MFQAHAMSDRSVALAVVVHATAAIALEGIAQDGRIPTFEVASIKPQEGDPGFVPSSPERFVDANATQTPRLRLMPPVSRRRRHHDGTVVPMRVRRAPAPGGDA